MSLTKTLNAGWEQPELLFDELQLEKQEAKYEEELKNVSTHIHKISNRLADHAE